MYIKQVIIQGFKTYKEETIVEPFHAGHNVVLGKNGHGKSNLLDAIQFVLSDKYSNLRTDEKIKLIYDGVGGQMMSASVEIIFDNSDSRFPNDKSEVSLKRSIGSKKDEYFLDNKHMSKTDVMNILESAGLSRSNPYYIVQQGKIRELIRMRDSNRLELFQEIAGTRIYDDRRAESLKIMKDTDHRREQIDSVLTFLEQRINELEDETKELKQYQSADSRRKACEYAIYDHALRQANDKIQQIDQLRSELQQTAGTDHAKFLSLQTEVQNMEQSITSLQELLVQGQSNKTAAYQRYQTELKKKTKHELNVKELQEKITNNDKNKEAASIEYKKLLESIASNQAKLEDLRHQFTQRRNEEEVHSTNLTRAQQRLDDLFAKQTRKSKFKTKKDRDTFLKQEVANSKKTRKDNENQLNSLTAENSASTARIEQINSLIPSKEEEMKKRQEDLNQIHNEENKIKHRKETLQKERQSTRNEERELTSQLQQAKSNFNTASDKLRTTMDKNMARGLASAKQIAQELGLTGYYGPLIELFHCISQFHLAVEITAGNSLFDVVVDTDETAARLIAELNRRQGGRITCVPLNTIKPIERTFPSDAKALPMINYLTFDPAVKKAMLQVFGRTVIARNLDAADEVAQEYGVNGITLTGDRVDRRGVMSGGSSDVKRTRLATQENIRNASAALKETEQQLAQLKTRQNQIDAEMNKLDTDLLKANDQRHKIRDHIKALETEIRDLKRESQERKTKIEHNENILSKVRTTIASIDINITSLESELTSDFSDELASQEEEELRRVQNEVNDLRNALGAASQAKFEVETTKNRLENLLQSNLQKREAELRQILSNTTQDEEKETLEREVQELRTIQAKVDELNAEVKAADQQVEHCKTSLRENQTKLEKLRADESKARNARTDELKNAERLLTKRTAAMKKKEECTRKIRELGSLPSELLNQYTKKSSDQLMRELENIMVDLKKYAHVNRKALDQYTACKKEREQISVKKEELDQGRKSILELISTLDQKKDEAIERTFKTIAKHFSTVFEELVGPEGKGTLVIKTRGLDDEEENEEELEQEEFKGEDDSSRTQGKKRRVGDDGKKGKKGGRRGQNDVVASGHVPTNQYSGIGIRVMFPGTSSETHQLSGGQESVVALCLIFAIQRCDPSPFYIFDEIDSALDPIHRTAVAKLIHLQAKETQFITTTFHPEQLVWADKFYGVVFKNKVSRVQVIDKEQAEEIIKMEEQESRQREKSTAPASSSDE